MKADRWNARHAIPRRRRHRARGSSGIRRQP
jgi:hypothetical protein